MNRKMKDVALLLKVSYLDKINENTSGSISILLQMIIQACAQTLKMMRTKSEPQVGVSVVHEAQTIKANKSLTQLHDLNAHLNLENSVITEDFIQQFSNKCPNLSSSKDYMMSPLAGVNIE